MKILFTGAKGMFASDFMNYLDVSSKHDLIGLNRNNLDITNRGSVKKVIKEKQPDVIIHSAAQTNVDLCEEKPEEAYKVNTFGTANVAYYAGTYGSRLVYISSCGLFGDEFKAYSEYDPVVLKSVYSRSKYLGEEKIKKFCPDSFIIRPGWLFGGSKSHSKNFVYKRYLEAKSKGVIESVVDKFGSPTYTFHLAKKIMELLETDYFDTYNITNQGYSSRYDYVKEIVKNFGLKTEVKPVKSDRFPRSAPVPDCEVLDNMNLRFHGFSLLTSWKAAIKEYVEKIKKELN
ncbi:MAG: SDR family oxidoreductase [Candidatus Hodarchaeales archaeon]|jgi:dTDP-4-dehydrorhamnose reductase